MGQPAYLLLDEGWVMLAHPVFRRRSGNGSRDAQNCAVILATKSVDASSHILDVLIESCPAKIFLPNGKRDPGHAGASRPARSAAMGLG